MALGAAYILVGISVALLIIYGADVMVGGGEGGDGFLPLSSALRGIIFGAPPIGLSIAAYFVARKDPSTALGGLIILTGALIIVGGAIALQGSTDPDSEARMVGEGAALVGIGGVIIGLGMAAIKRATSG